MRVKDIHDEHRSNDSSEGNQDPALADSNEWIDMKQAAKIYLLIWAHRAYGMYNHYMDYIIFITIVNLVSLHIFDYRTYLCISRIVLGG